MMRILRYLAQCSSRFRWIVLAFIASGGLVAGLLIWQLLETSPNKWCSYVGEATPQGCFDVLLKLIDVKDTAIIGLLTILGLTVASVVAVTLRVKIDIQGPGGTGGNIQGDDDNA